MAIPAPFDNPPEVWPWLEIFSSAWNTLNQERPDGAQFEQVLRITREQVRNWLVWHGFDKDRLFAEDCIFYVNRIENMFIPLERKRRQEVIAKQKAEAKREAARRARGR